MAKEIFKREALGKKVTMLELEKQDQSKQLAEAYETIKTLQKELSGQKKQIDVHRTRKEYMEYVADEANKDNKLLQSEMQSISTELAELKKVSSVVETLAKVGNKAHWANTIKSSQSEEDQAKIFYDAYRLQLAREEDFKDKINELKD